MRTAFFNVAQPWCRKAGEGSNEGSGLGRGMTLKLGVAKEAKNSRSNAARYVT